MIKTRRSSLALSARPFGNSDLQYDVVRLHVVSRSGFDASIPRV